MKEIIHIEPDYKHFFSWVDPNHPFESISQHFGYQLGPDQRRRSKVSCGQLIGKNGEPLEVYFKLYGYRRIRRVLSRMLKPTRSQSEIKNLQFFHQLGIPACTPIVQGEYRNFLGIARNCMLITVKIQNTQQLDVFMTNLENSNDSETTKKAIRHKIIRSIATNLKKIHAHRFFHDDLKWRNILIRRTQEPSNNIEVFWIDCPNGYFDKIKLRTQHGIIKDLATMDHEAKDRISLEDRQLFLSIYSDLKPESPHFSKLANKVTDYRKLKLD